MSAGNQAIYIMVAVPKETIGTWVLRFPTCTVHPQVKCVVKRNKPFCGSNGSRVVTRTGVDGHCGLHSESVSSKVAG